MFFTLSLRRHPLLAPWRSISVYCLTQITLSGARLSFLSFSRWPFPSSHLLCCRLIHQLSTYNSHRCIWACACLSLLLTHYGWFHQFLELQIGAAFIFLLLCPCQTAVHWRFVPSVIHLHRTNQATLLSSFSMAHVCCWPTAPVHIAEIFPPLSDFYQ